MNALVPNRTWATGVPRLSDDIRADLIAHYENVSRRLSKPPRFQKPIRIVWDFPITNKGAAPIEPTSKRVAPPNPIDDYLNSRLRIRDIIRKVCSHYGVTLIDIVSDRRTDRVVIPRHVAMFLAKEFTTHSLPEIGRHFGGRDHTTVLFAVRKIARLTAASPEFAEQVETLRAACLCKEGDGT